MDIGSSLTRMSTKYCTKLDRKEKIKMKFCFSDSILLHILGEAIENVFWNKLDALY